MKNRQNPMDHEQSPQPPLSTDTDMTDPLSGDPFTYDPVAGFDLYDDPWASELLSLELPLSADAPEVQMQQRPGDLADDALAQMHQDLTYQQLDHVPYSQVFMDQHGMNDTRRRHFDLLMGGLDDVGSQES